MYFLFLKKNIHICYHHVVMVHPISAFEKAKYKTYYGLCVMELPPCHNL